MDSNGGSDKSLSNNSPRSSWSAWNPVSSSTLQKAYEKSKEVAAIVSTSFDQNLNSSKKDIMQEDLQQPLVRTFSTGSINQEDNGKLASSHPLTKDLARAFKNLQKKNILIENMLTRTTPIQSISSPADLEAAENFIRELKASNITSTKHIQQMQEIQLLEASAKQDMFESLTLEINALKQGPLISLADDNHIDVSELTQQRDGALERCRLLELTAERQSKLIVEIETSNDTIRELRASLTSSNSVRRASIEAREMEAGYNSRIATLQTRLEGTEKEKVEYIGQLAANQEIINTMQKKVVDIQSNIDRKSGVAEKLALKVRELEARLAQNSTAETNKAEEHSERVAYLEEESQTYLLKLQEGTAAVDSLTEKTCELEASLTKINQSSLENLSNVNSRLAQQTTDLAVKDKELSELKVLLSSYQLEISELSVAITGKNVETKESFTELESAKQLLQASQLELMAANTELNALKSATQQADSHDLNGPSKVNEDKLRAMESQIEFIRSEAQAKSDARELDVVEKSNALLALRDEEQAQLLSIYNTLKLRFEELQASSPLNTDNTSSANVQRDLHETNLDADTLSQGYSIKCKEYESVIANLENRIGANNVEHSTLDYDAKNAEISALHTQLFDLKGAYTLQTEGLVEKSKSLDLELKTAAESVEAMQAVKSELDVTREKLDEATAMYSAQFAEREIRALSKQITDMASDKSSIIDSSDLLAKANADLVEMQQILDEAKSQHGKDLQGHISITKDLQSQLELAESAAIANNDQSTAANEIRTKLELTEKEYISKNSALEQLVGESQQLLEQSKETNQKLELADVDTRARLLSAEEGLALSKQSIHLHDTMMADLQEKLKRVQQSASEEEEKKNKSIALLRNSKARILKLEGDVKASKAELDKLIEQATERDSSAKERELQILTSNAIAATLNGEIQALTRQLEESRSRKSDDWERKRKELENQMEVLALQISALQQTERKLVSEKVVISERVKSLESQILQLRQTTDGQAELLRNYPVQVKELEASIHNLDQDLETSNRLFESKSIENDAFKPRISELEAQVYETQELVNRKQDEIDLALREAKELRRELQIRSVELNRCEVQALDAKKDVESCREVADKRVAEADKGLMELHTVKIENKALAIQLADAQNGFSHEKVQNAELAAAMTSKEEDSTQNLKDKENMIEDMKGREVQLKNVNKEVRKLSRTLLTSSSSATNVSSPLARGADLITTGGASTPSRTPSSPPSQLGNFLQRLSISSIPSQQAAPYQRRSTDSSISPRSAELPDPNPEYLKHVILKFIEAKDKRGQLVQVLGMLLKFTPEELKRASIRV